MNLFAWIARSPSRGAGALLWRWLWGAGSGEQASGGHHAHLLPRASARASDFFSRSKGTSVPQSKRRLLHEWMKPPCVSRARWQRALNP
ncbi:hypothetical protein T484DRAFT_1976606 [Baffinella frigidus]|nr:hypothetical protein T484DRAFT_1976606 [Cryptophyta sp. CCMP2293]